MSCSRHEEAADLIESSRRLSGAAEISEDSTWLQATSSNNALPALRPDPDFFALWLVAICLRLVYLQIFCYGDFARRAQHQQQRTIELSPKRGVIYDRAGRELAMSMQVDSAFVVPAETPDLANTSA